MTKTERKPKRAPAKTKAAAVQSTLPADTTPARPADAAALTGKLAELLKLVRRKTGASIEEMVSATGWQAHSVRGAISGTLRKRLGLTVELSRTEGVTRYRVAT